MELFTSDSSTCHHCLTEWRPDMKQRLNEDKARYILNSVRGKAYNLSYAIIFFDVKEEDIEKELITTNYKRIKVG